MPKKVFKIDQFHGGLNNNSDPRDIADNELAYARDLMVDNLGKIRLMGSSIGHVSSTPEDDQASGWTGTLIGGYGLFYFSHDRTGGENKSALTGVHDGGDGVAALTDGAEAWITDALIGGIVYNVTDGSSGPITDNTDDDVTATLSGGTNNDWDDDDVYYISMPVTGDDYLAIYDGHDGQVWIYSRIRDAWDDEYALGGGASNNGIIDIGSSNTDEAEVNYYAVDGALRVCDGNFTNSNTPKWYGYTHRSHFTLDGPTGGTHATKVDHSKWVSTNQQMLAPTRGLLGNTEVTGYELDGTHTASTSATVLRDPNAFTGYTDKDFTDNDYIVVNNTSDKYATVSAWNDVNELTTTSIPDNWDTSDTWSLYPASGTGFNIDLNWISSPVGTWGDAITHEFAASFVYDGNQETELYYYNDTAASINNQSLFIGFYSIGNFDSRYTDFRLYYRVNDSDPTWLFLAEVSLSKGARSSELGTYEGWSDGDPAESNGTTIISHRTYITIIDPPTASTYAIKSGIPDDKRITFPKYKTAVVANRRAYIGNVQYTDSGSIVQTKGDAILKSPVNQFDTFGLNGLIEASVNDGDNIVKLEAYADRLLIFKKNKMELLNISQEIEFLEDTFVGKGVTHPAATCKTDFGIAWVNREGVYLYDGQKVNNLFEKQGRQIITQASWHVLGTTDGFIDSSDLANPDEPMIGYLPKKRQLIVSADVANGGGDDTDIFLYDMITQSWVEGNGKLPSATSGSTTNLINDWNRDLIWAYSTGIVQAWSDSSILSASFELITKDIDFGFPGIRKKIYKVYISYKGDADNVTVQYAFNGDTNTVNPFYRTTADGSSDGSNSDTTPLLDSNTDDWILAELKPVSSINNVYSFHLELGGNAGADFEINDISIVYRLKGIK